jgi:hypothetical protein
MYALSSFLLFFFFFYLDRLCSFGLFAFRINLRLDLTDSWQDFLDGWSAHRKASTYTGQHKHRRNVDGHPCLKRGSNPRSQCLSGGKCFMPQTAHPLWSVLSPRKSKFQFVVQSYKAKSVCCSVRRIRGIVETDHVTSVDVIRRISISKPFCGTT